MLYLYANIHVIDTFVFLADTRKKWSINWNQLAWVTMLQLKKHMIGLVRHRLLRQLWAFRLRRACIKMWSKCSFGFIWTYHNVSCFESLKKNSFKKFLLLIEETCLHHTDVRVSVLQNGWKQNGFVFKWNQFRFHVRTEILQASLVIFTLFSLI